MIGTLALFMTKEAYIAKTPEGHAVFSETGKKLSIGYPSKGQAERRLAQIEYFKKLKAKKPAEKDKDKTAEEKLKGGEADGKPDSAFPKSEVQQGTKVEFEHVNDKDKAKEIAKDHLAESVKYYDELEEMEENLEKEARIVPSFLGKSTGLAPKIKAPNKMTSWSGANVGVDPMEAWITKMRPKLTPNQSESSVFRILDQDAVPRSTQGWRPTPPGPTTLAPWEHSRAAKNIAAGEHAKSIGFDEVKDSLSQIKTLSNNQAARAPGAGVMEHYQNAMNPQTVDLSHLKRFSSGANYRNTRNTNNANFGRRDLAVAGAGAGLGTAALAGAFAAK